MSNYCPYPFLAVCLSPGDYVVPCCHMDWTDLTDDWQTKNIDTAFHNKAFKNLRKDLIKGNKPKSCNKCWQAEERGVKSARQIGIEKFSKYTINEQNLNIKFLDVKFDNKCNFGCRMCNPWNSDKIANLIKSNPKLHSVFQTNSLPIDFNNTNKVEYVKFLMDKGLKHLKVTGGEPLISKSFLEVLDYAVSTKRAADITIDITTNGSKFTKKLFSKLCKFKKINFNISVDGTGKTYEYIRHPYSWDKLDFRIRQLFEYFENNTSKLTVKLSCVVSVYNILNLIDLELYWQDIMHIYNKFEIDNIYFDPFLKPNTSYMNIRYLDNMFKNKINPIIPDNIRNYLDTTFSEYDPIKKSLLEKNTVLLDNYYNKSYKDYLHPYIVDYIEGENFGS